MERRKKGAFQQKLGLLNDGHESASEKSRSCGGKKETGKRPSFFSLAEWAVPIGSIWLDLFSDLSFDVFRFSLSRSFSVVRCRMVRAREHKAPGCIHLHKLIRWLLKTCVRLRQVNRICISKLCRELKPEVSSQEGEKKKWFRLFLASALTRSVQFYCVSPSFSG